MTYRRMSKSFAASTVPTHEGITWKGPQHIPTDVGSTRALLAFFGGPHRFAIGGRTWASGAFEILGKSSIHSKRLVLPPPSRPLPCSFVGVYWSGLVAKSSSCKLRKFEFDQFLEGATLRTNEQYNWGHIPVVP